MSPPSRNGVRTGRKIHSKTATVKTTAPHDRAWRLYEVISARCGEKNRVVSHLDVGESELTSGSPSSSSEGPQTVQCHALHRRPLVRGKACRSPNAFPTNVRPLRRELTEDRETSSWSPDLTLPPSMIGAIEVVAVATLFRP